MVTTLWQDLRYALRAFRTRPLHGGVTVRVLAIAIGANTTVFSLINGLFLRPLLYPDGDRLVMVYNAYEKLGLTDAGISIPDYLDRRAQATSLEELGIYRVAGRALTGEGPTQDILVAIASPSLFGVLGIAPQLGRAFTEQEGTPGNDAVAVVSHDLWVQRFGGRTDIVGKEIRLDGQTLQIVGVMPAGFGFPNRIVQVWVPYAFTPQQASDTARGNEFSISIGRLKPGATLARLNSELGVIVHRVADRLPSIQDAVTVAGFTGKAQPWRQAEVGNLSQLLLVLQATVLAVLLIACANLANLQLARLTSRRRELTLRTTLGATRTQLLRPVLVEAVVLSAVGAGVGRQIEQAVWSVNASLPVASARTMLDLYERSLARTAFTLVMLIVAAGAALVLGVVGLYGVLSYAVSQRRREVAIRLALGARQRDVQGRFVRYGVTLAGLGVVIGLVGAAGATRLMSAILYDVQPIDPLTYAAVAAGLTLVAALASYLPARRAAAVAPAESLAAE